MNFAGELHCICCGYVAGDVDGDPTKPISQARLTPARNGPGFTQRIGERPRCGRCSGRLIIQERDDFVRISPPILAIETPTTRKSRRTEESALVA
jgi:hypothetical protein